MFNLFVSYFKTDNPKRQEEIDTCLKKNLTNVFIKNIYLLVEEPLDLSEFKNNKLKSILIKSRPSYNNIFEIIKQNSGNTDWNIIANSDIYFDESISFVERYKSRKPVCLALCRWEVVKGSTHFLNRKDSQDCWIFKGHPGKVEGDFKLGTAGCDNAIADRFFRAGYEVLNPSRTIKTYHLHESQERTYDPNIKVAQPYRLLTPTL